MWGISDMKMSFISLFSGAGGLDLGLEKAGWDCRYASDIDADAVATLKANQGRLLSEMSSPAFENTYIERADVRGLTGEDILQKAGAQRGDIRLLVGGPPCQSWSSAGHQKGFEDPRGQLFADFVRLADEVGVDFVLFENVRGLLTARGPDGTPGGALEHVRKQLLERGFQTSAALLNAADFGIPQRRVRLFVLGSRFGAADFAPDATHSKAELSHLPPWVTLGECISGLSPLQAHEIVRPSGKLADQLRDVSPGSGVKSPGKKEATRPGGHWGYKQGAFVADLTIPARTVTANSQQDWVIDPVLGLRKLTHRECAAIQSFPPQWEWIGNKSARFRLIGNAVPPALGQAVGRSLLSLISGTARIAKSDHIVHERLMPLPENLSKAVSYTVREERRNGESRRMAPIKRKSALSVAQFGDSIAQG